MKRVVLLFLLLLLAGCGAEYDVQNGEEREMIGNPYTEGTGHYAGYEWAERTGGDCNGNSQSFNEGCEEYYRQLYDQYEN